MKQQKQPVGEETQNKALEEAMATAENWKNKYIRALADYQNLEKRTNEEKQEVRLYATRLFLEKLLPVVDNLERAQGHIQDEGLSLVLQELHAVLASHGVEKIDCIGKVFDPYAMECIEVVEGKKDTVIAVVIPGYTMHGKLLREAKVNVGGGEKSPPAKNEGDIS